MTPLLIILLPALLGVLCLAAPSKSIHRWILLAGASVHSVMVILLSTQTQSPFLNGWIRADALSLLFVTVLSVIFFTVSVYAFGYLHRETESPRHDWVEGSLFSNAPEKLFAACMLFFLAAMSLVTLSHHLGLLWVGVESTTLASAPLIYFHRHHRSLEATWKYLIISSVGIALALLGTLFIAASTPVHGQSTLVISELVGLGADLNPVWLKAGFLLLLVGYGTKMGLAPMHTWLPDAHSESPSLVSALMSGTLLNCAFLAILRVYEVLVAGGEGQFARDTLVGFGLTSMAVAGVFIIKQGDYKRMLAYSSVEHMGILALAVGIGGNATFGAMYQLMNHSLSKAMLFIVAGNILAAVHSTSVRLSRGLLQFLPISGALWILGFLAITGVPPFGTFFSEFTILQSAISQGRTITAVLYLVLLAIVFMGMATITFRMVHGEPIAERVAERVQESWLAVLPAAALGIAVLLLGIYVPNWVHDMFTNASAVIGG